MTQTQTELRIDPELRDLLPALAKSEREYLERSLVEEGVRDPLIVWGDILVDGHHRYEICQRLDIPFNTASMDFKDKNEALAWIIKNQLARRNLVEYVRTKYALKLRDILEPQARERQKAGVKANLPQPVAEGSKRNDEKPSQPVAESSESKNDREVRAQIGKAAGVSRETVRKVETIEKEGDEEVKQKAASGELGISAAYRLARLGKSLSDPEEEFAAEEIKSIKDARFTAVDETGKTKTLSRNQLLKEHGFAKCKHCGGYGITKKGERQ
jgi:transcriptional regulator with XRE-family HTH domain